MKWLDDLDIPVVEGPFDGRGYLVALMIDDGHWGTWIEPSRSEAEEVASYIAFARDYLACPAEDRLAKDSRSNTLTIARGERGWSAHRYSWRRQGFITKPDYTPDVTGLRNLLADLGVSAYSVRRGR